MLLPKNEVQVVMVCGTDGVVIITFMEKINWTSNVDIQHDLFRSHFSERSVGGKKREILKFSGRIPLNSDRIEAFFDGFLGLHTRNIPKLLLRITLFSC